MAIPAKPTQRLAVDGIIGQKTRDAAAYAFRRDRFTTGTEVSGLKPIHAPLQAWLNSSRQWKEIDVYIEPGSSVIPWYWNRNLAVDGKWGPQTQTKLGGTIARCSFKPRYGCSDFSERYLREAGANAAAFQALLNGIIFREIPTGPIFICGYEGPFLDTTVRQKWQRVPAGLPSGGNLAP